MRISFIEFLNAVPLGWGFLHGSLKGKHQILFDVPAECARHLESGEADAGLIPVIEYQRIAGLQVVPEISIASKREVRSVLFLSRVPIRSVRRIAVDVSSRTSVALLKILLSEFYGLRNVEFFDCPPSPREMLRDFDAALVIGNPALQVPVDGLYVHDLAAEWNRFTGLPFVFAFWAVRPESLSEEDLRDFHRSRDEGLKSLPFIAEWYSSRLPVTAPDIRSYLTRNLDFSLDVDNRRGLERFFDLAEKLGLIERVQPLRFARIPSLHCQGQEDAGSAQL